jgi:hypothetical protein
MCDEVNTMLNVAVSFNEYEDADYNLRPCAEGQMEELCLAGVNDRSQEEKVAAICELVPTCAQNLDIDTSSAVSVLF